ncbi:MAG TPA: hypothetical protein VJT72_04455 [Pseudonocardiaceae bacterium]|nr:hypothetical protein [Pseudonocardiaceae bacterium]
MFAIDTAAAAEITASIGQIQESLDKRLRLIQSLTRQAPPLGDLSEARAIATLDTLVACGDQQSLDFALQRFAAVLDDLHQAVETCMRDYEQNDTQSARVLKEAGSS